MSALVEMFLGVHFEREAQRKANGRVDYAKVLRLVTVAQESLGAALAECDSHVCDYEVKKALRSAAYEASTAVRLALGCIDDDDNDEAATSEGRPNAE